jgi:transposase InsO family protein
LTRDKALSALKLSRHQYYYKAKSSRPGRKPTQTTKRMLHGKLIEQDDKEVVRQVEQIRKDPDTNYGYRRMCAALMILGYFINHKKVYRLMKENHMLAKRHKAKGKNFAQYRIVIPQGPLEVIEMDIKYVWVVGTRSHAYILTILDTFTRFVLHWQAGFWMKSGQVKQAWEQVIANHLQPADMLNRGIHVEIRNDNGPQFGAKAIQGFFEKNHLNQVFTHPYTPQENGHIESFHSILSSALDNQVFWDLDQLLDRLTVFYEKYNNVRLHGSIANLTPALFWELWDKGLISRKVNEKSKRVTFKLLMPYQHLSGNGNLREVPCLNPEALDVLLDLPNEAIGPETLLQPSVQRSPSVVPC